MTVGADAGAGAVVDTGAEVVEGEGRDAAAAEGRRDIEAKEGAAVDGLEKKDRSVEIFGAMPDSVR